MPNAMIRVWWLTKHWHAFGAAFGIGHSSLELGTEYITWLGAPGTSSSSRSSRSARSSSVARSVSNTSESSSTVDSLAGLRNGTHGILDDETTFGRVAREVAIPIVDAQTPFGLRDDAQVVNWWRTKRAAAGMYSALSTASNCNAVVRQALMKANAGLYATAPEFSMYAGSNKVLDFATAVAAKVAALNTTWRSQRMLGSKLGADRGEGHAVPDIGWWDGTNGPVEVPTVRANLALYHGALAWRDELERLRLILNAVCLRLVTTPAPPPAAPPAVVAPAMIAPVAPVAAVVPAVPAPVDAFADIRRFGRIVRAAMLHIEGQAAAAT